MPPSDESAFTCTVPSTGLDPQRGPGPIDMDDASAISLLPRWDSDSGYFLGAYSARLALSDYSASAAATRHRVEFGFLARTARGWFEANSGRRSLKIWTQLGHKTGPVSPRFR